MKTRIGTLAFTIGLLTAPSIEVSADTFDPNELEPCINGEVSGSGLFPSQALEDDYKALIVQLTRDPCSVHRITAPARFPTKQMEAEYGELVQQAESKC